jgi:hypothetical protein
MGKKIFKKILLTLILSFSAVFIIVVFLDILYWLRY